MGIVVKKEKTIKKRRGLTTEYSTTRVGVEPKRKGEEIKKRKGLAITSLILNLFFLIPILNIIFSGLAIVLGIRALTNIKNKPSEYGGKALAITGIVWGVIVIITTIFSIFYYYFVYKR